MSSDPAAGLRRLPKIELHLHLDACVRVETVRAIGRELGIALPEPLETALEAPEVCRDLIDYLSRLDLALEVMQRPQDLVRIAGELVDDLAADGVVYAEVRFAPQLHIRRGLSLGEVLEAVHAGLVAGRKRSGVATGLILCCLRHQDTEQSLEVAALGAANPDKVCGLDLAGDEAGHPDVGRHVPAFALARRAGLHITAHAGENGGARNVRAALETLGAERIGHGVRVEEDPELVDRLAAEPVSLDMCPRSNVQTRAVESLAAHPIDRLLRRGVRVTVSTDGRTTSRTTLTEELAGLMRQFGWGLEQMASCQANAARAAFVSEDLRNELLSVVSEERFSRYNPAHPKGQGSRTGPSQD